MAQEEELVESGRLVRPYTLTRGRTRPASRNLPIEALVRTVGPQDAPLDDAPAGTPERRRIRELAADGFLSLAELSAHLSLPLGVVRVLVGDLADDGLVVVHTGSPQSSTPEANLKVLESALDGIASL
jgi:Protein of unknown function (DUF742)